MTDPRTALEEAPFADGTSVVLVQCNGWNQPLRKWAEQGRTATVVKCLKGFSSRHWRVVVRFDHRRRDIRDTFAPDDLALAAAARKAKEAGDAN